MTLIRKEGKINDHTFMIDALHKGISGGHAVYLLKSGDGGTCLIDAGTKDSAKGIYEKLRALDAWPIDKIIFTHSHWDHTQGIGILRAKAAETGDAPEVFASEKAMPYLADQSYNICFGTDQAPYQNIDGVLGLKNGDPIDVGGDLTIKILDTPGHMVDHLSIWDENTGNIFVGDAFGMKWSDDLIVPNPNSHFWNEKDFLNSTDLIKSLHAKTICLAHFGCLSGGDAQSFLDDSVSFYGKWMEIFYKNSGRLEDISFLVDILLTELYQHLPEGLRALVQPPLAEAVELAAGAYAKQHP
jgi:glyoxylase-like metal-dependent hydrolase (beta-lactamase superfamily II)